jgi:GT2 family glycosyltransferase
MPKTELERRPVAASDGGDELQPLAALLAADVVAVHLAPEDGEPGLELSILDEAAPDEVRSQCVDLRSFLREHLGPLEREEREAVLELMDEVAAAQPGSCDPIGFATSRALFREALREPLPSATVDCDEPQGLHFDSVLALSESSFYVRGWARDGQAGLVRLTAVSPEGSRIELLPGIHREPRPDVDDFYQDPVRKGDEGTGFLGYCESRAPSMLSSGWVLEMENALGVLREVSGPEVSRDLSAARTVVLSDLHKERRWDTALMDHVVPAIETIQGRLEAEAEIEAVWQFGEPPQQAETSIIVPLYGRTDFLEHQLAQFVHDPELSEADLIYVLDSPELAESLEQAAGQLFELYGLPFRVAVLARNGGYSVANNRGASLARGRLLLLLNSDVLPDGPGWLSRLAAFYDGREDAGAVGPKLLFEDDTLQHAGIRFQRPAGGGAWENEHYFKGLHRDLPAANVARRVPAVSGACLMIARELFEELGGLRGTYVQGDYEDTDLCLRLREAGHETWYCPEVELYHLEGQSYAIETRQAMSRFNTWLHTRLWDAEIENLMSELR